LRFGEAAVALDLASDDDVVWALSQQFHYPYAPGQKHDNPELVAAASPFSAEAEVFRELRSQLLLGVLDPEQPRRALAVVSPNVGDGKTYVAANIGVALSQLGGRTLLVDADMRTPRQQEMFGIQHPGTGLSSILTGRAGKSVIRRVRDLPSLFVLPVGTIPPNPLELVQRPAFELLIREMLNKFDHVVVDTPAATHGADSRVIAAKCGAVLAIGRRGRTRMKAMDSLISALARGPAQLAGVVMNEF
jgi:chain length determinant protein tyrosine kinase EpsG